MDRDATMREIVAKLNGLSEEQLGRLTDFLTSLDSAQGAGKEKFSGANEQTNHNNQ